MGLLGHALARAAGSSFQDLVQERIVEPLGMSMTGYARDGERAEWMTRGHNQGGGVVPYWDASDAIAGAGGLRSTAEDMLRYLKAQLGAPRTDLERALRAAHEVRRPVNPRMGVGLGWQVQREGDRTILSHGGGTAGYRTMIGFDPERRVGFVLLTNSGGFEDDLGMDLLRRGPPLAIPEVSVGREVLATYVGEYELAPGRTAVVRLEEEGHLTVQVPGNVRYRMYAESEANFFLKRAPWRLAFTKDETGKVAGLNLDMNGTERSARKVN